MCGRRSNSSSYLHSHTTQGRWNHQRHAPESWASPERTRRPDNRVGHLPRATPPSARRRRGTTTGALPDCQSLAANSPRRARLAARGLRLLQRRPQPRPRPPHAQIPGSRWGDVWRAVEREPQVEILPRVDARRGPADKMVRLCGNPDPRSLYALAEFHRRCLFLLVLTRFKMGALQFSRRTLLSRTPRLRLTR